MYQVLFAVLIVLAAFGGTVFWLKKRNYLVTAWPAKSDAAIRVLGRLRLTPQHSLHWVRAGDREILLALYPGGCTVIHEENKP